MKLPKQSQPVPRPMLHDPYPTVDLKLLESIVSQFQADVDEFGDELSKRNLKAAKDALFSMRFDLLHSINHDDPQAFSGPADVCGCQILSGQARLMCIVGCGWF